MFCWKFPAPYPPGWACGGGLEKTGGREGGRDTITQEGTKKGSHYIPTHINRVGIPIAIAHKSVLAFFLPSRVFEGTFNITEVFEVIEVMIECLQANSFAGLQVAHLEGLCSILGSPQYLGSQSLYKNSG